jgi:hypothetical protein
MQPPLAFSRRAWRRGGDLLAVMVLPKSSQHSAADLSQPHSCMYRLIDTCAREGREIKGIKRTELTSGTPPSPGGRGSAVMEALDGRRGSVHSIAASEDGGLGGVRVNATITTRTTTASIWRHCYSIATVGIGWV